MKGIAGRAALAAAAVIPLQALAQGEAPTSSGRIVGGRPTTVAENPWIVPLKVVEPDGASVLCAGSVVNAHAIVTAAHCFGIDPRRVRVYFKEGVTDHKSEGVWRLAAKVAVHECFRFGIKKFDVAVVRSNNELTSASIQLAETEPEPAQRATVTGWGATAQFGHAEDSLRTVDVPIVSNAICNAEESYAGAIDTSQLCAGEKAGGTDACQGDSGGPLILRRPDGGASLIGIVSYGNGCAAADRYGVYSSVAHFRTWIIRKAFGDAPPGRPE